MKRQEVLKMSKTEFQEWATNKWKIYYKWEERTLLSMIVFGLGAWIYAMWSIWNG